MGSRYGTTLNLDTFELLTDDGGILTQAIETRLSTRPGVFFTDPLYGLDVHDLLGEGYDATKGARLGARIAGEVSEDERVETATATVDAGGRFVVAVAPLDGGDLRYRGNVDDIRPALTAQDAEEGA